MGDCTPMFCSIPIVQHGSSECFFCLFISAIPSSQLVFVNHTYIPDLQPLMFNSLYVVGCSVPLTVSIHSQIDIFLLLGLNLIAISVPNITVEGR